MTSSPRVGNEAIEMDASNKESEVHVIPRCNSIASKSDKSGGEEQPANGERQRSSKVPSKRSFHVVHGGSVTPLDLHTLRVDAVDDDLLQLDNVDIKIETDEKLKQFYRHKSFLKHGMSLVQLQPYPKQCKD